MSQHNKHSVHKGKGTPWPLPLGRAFRIHYFQESAVSRHRSRQQQAAATDSRRKQEAA